MKFSLFIFVFSLFILTGCTKTVYVPIESVKTEYIDHIRRDSVHLYDSVFVDRYLNGDTVFLTKEKYKYLYRDKLVRDSVFITDSVAVPYPVKGDTQYVNRLTSFQSFQIWCGRVLLLLITGIAIYIVIKWRLKGSFLKS